MICVQIHMGKFTRYIDTENTTVMNDIFLCGFRIVCPQSNITIAKESEGARFSLALVS